MELELHQLELRYERLRKRAPVAERALLGALAEHGQRLPIVVIVNPASASASEILAGALQDHDRAVILGTPTFGKGVAYLLIPLTETEAVTVTSSRWYTPSGRSIQRGSSGSRNMALMAARNTPADTTPREYRTDSGRLLDAGDGGIQPDIDLTKVIEEEGGGA